MCICLGRPHISLIFELHKIILWSKVINVNVVIINDIRDKALQISVQELASVHLSDMFTYSFMVHGADIDIIFILNFPSHSICHGGHGFRPRSPVKRTALETHRFNASITIALIAKHFLLQSSGANVNGLRLPTPS